MFFFLTQNSESEQTDKLTNQRLTVHAEAAQLLQGAQPRLQVTGGPGDGVQVVDGQAAEAGQRLQHFL